MDTEAAQHERAERIAGNKRVALERLEAGNAHQESSGGGGGIEELWELWRRMKGFLREKFGNEFALTCIPGKAGLPGGALYQRFHAAYLVAPDKSIKVVFHGEGGGGGMLLYRNTHPLSHLSSHCSFPLC